ncbi:MAG: hypothetical protein WCD52_22595, partial [Xanthobacteraceae bacterium]
MMGFERANHEILWAEFCRVITDGDGNMPCLARGVIFSMGTIDTDEAQWRRASALLTFLRQDPGKYRG